MFRPITSLPLQVCAAVALAATLTTSQALAITFGEVDTTNRFPSVGALVITRPPTDIPELEVPRISASGTLIHPRVLLTAGHVTATYEYRLANGTITLDDLRVSFGADAFDATTWLEIEAVVTHPDFSFVPVSDFFFSDVGLVILKEPVDLPCVTLAPSGFLDDLNAAGLLRDDGKAAEFLQVGYGSTLSFPPPQDFAGDGLRRFVFSPYQNLHDAWLFTNQNPAAGFGGGGFGDSGGPRYWVAPDGTLVQVAINSRGPQQWLAVDIAYRIDRQDVLEFIDLVVTLVDAGVW